MNDPRIVRRHSVAWRLASSLLRVNRIHLIAGGLGNQMYQHAYAIALQAVDGADALIDISRCRRTGPYTGYEIDRVFCMDGAVRPSRRTMGALLYRLARRTRDVSNEGGDIRFAPSFLSPGLRGYVKGFFPSFRYFSNPEAERRVRAAFRFRQAIPVQHAALCRELSEGDSVAVHVRRGDYLIGEHARAFMGICTPAYYRAAIHAMRRLRPAARFYFFSDDPGWCREAFGDDASLVMSGNDRDNAWVDMALMSRCRHAIIANSSFSWWARWLGGYEAAICIGPSCMMNDPRTISSIEDFLPPHFIRIDHQGAVVHPGNHGQ